MEWDFSDIDAMSEPKKKVWDFSDIDAMGSEPTQNEWDFSDIDAMGGTATEQIPPVPDRQDLGQFLAKYGNKAIGHLDDFASEAGGEISDIASAIVPFKDNSENKYAFNPSAFIPSASSQDLQPPSLPVVDKIGLPPLDSQLSQLSQPEPEVIRDFFPAVAAGENRYQMNRGIAELDQRKYNEENPFAALMETVANALAGKMTKKAKSEEEVAALEQDVAERTKVAEEERVMGTKDVDFSGGVLDGLGDALDFVAGNVGASAPAMLRAIASGGSMTPQIMSDEINAELTDMKDLSSKDQMALSKGGGVIAAGLEQIGLGFIIKGIPPGVFAKMGLKKTAALIESKILAKVAVRGGVASLTESITEGGQQGVGIAAQIIAGKEFQPGEIYEEIIEAAKVGAAVGGALATGGSATVESAKKVGKKEIQPEQTESVEPKFDKTAEGSEGIELQDEAQFDTDTEPLTEPQLDPVTEETIEQLEDKPVKKEPFKIEPKVVEKEGGDQESEAVVETKVAPVAPEPPPVSTPQGEEVSPPGQSGVPVTKVEAEVLPPVLPPVVPPQEVDTVQDDTVQDTDQGESNGGVAAEVGVEPEVEAGPKKVAKKDFAQKVLAKKQEEEFDRLADGIEPDEESINLTDEDRAEAEESDGLLYSIEDRDWPDVELERRDERVTVAFLKEHGIGESESSRKPETFKLVGDNKVVVYTSHSSASDSNKDLIDQKTFNNPSLGELREYMGYSKGPAPTGININAGQTPEAVQKETEATFGKKTVRTLTKNGALKIVKSAKDLPGTMKAKLMKDNANNVGVIKGAYDPKTGVSYLVADNIAPGEAAGVFLHEVGEHASLDQMVGKKNYDQIATQIDDLVKGGDEVAVAANARIPKNTKKEYLQSEKIAYLVQEVQDRTAKGETISSKAKTLYNRVINLIRNYFNKLPAYRKMAGRAALKKLESGQLLTPENITSLARAAVDFHAEGKTQETEAKGATQFSEADPEVETGPEPKLGESKFVNVTESITAAHGKKKKPKAEMLDSIWDATVETATVIKDQMTRSHKLLDPKKFGATTDYLRLMQETGSYAKHKAYTDVYSVIGKMNDIEQLILSMNMVLPDMLKDIESGLLDAKVGLPFGYKSVKDVKADLANFRRQAKAVGEDASTDVDINASIKKRTEFMKNLREELVAEGLLRKELANDDRYFHHQVLEYLNMEDAGYTSSVQKPGIRETKKGWQKSRTGSTKDYNTKYLDAEFEVLSQSRQQLEAKRLLNKIKIANDKSSAARKLRTELNAKRTDKKENELSLEQTLKQSEEFDGYVVWEPNDKGVFYQTYSVADKVAQQILEDGGAEVTKVQKVFARGAKEKWVIPKELAETLNTPTRNENEAWPFSWSRKGIRAWKVWTLLNPFRILRYNLNNMSGDLDIALAYDPKMIFGMKKSIKDLLLDRKNPNSKVSEELNEARKWGIIDSGFVITEVDDFSKMYEGLFDPKPSNNPEKLTQAGKNIPKNFREWTTYRENIIRLTAWRHFKKKIKDNPDKKIYAASKQTEIDQITDTDQKAAKLARELIGDYGNISHAGRAIRSHLMPFYSWMEINAPRYIRLMKNSKDEGNDIKAQLAKVAAKQTVIKGVGVMARMAAFSTFVSVYNAAFFSDEEEKLSEFERQQLHIILGTWDGEIKTLRFQGAFSDFVSWASLHDLPSDLVDLAKGEKSVTDQMTEMAKAPALKLAAGLSPLYKVPAELLSGETYWPDFLNPRPIRDRFEHIANAFSLGTVYKQLAGKPNKGFGEWSKLLISSTDPGESAYYKNWERVRKWRDKLGKDDVGSFSPTTKSNALYYYKQAMKYQDLEAAWKYYVKYINLSGGVLKDGTVPKKTLKNIDKSIKRANPKSGIPSGTWNDFQKTLSQGEKKTWNTGIDWYEETYKKR